MARGQHPDGVSVCWAGTDLVSGGDIWKRIYQPSYIQEQYVLTHCSVSTDRSQGLLSRSSTSSESTGSRDVAPEGGSPAPDAASQQGQKSLSLCESSTKSAPLPSAPAPAAVKVRLIHPRHWGWSPRSWGLDAPLCLDTWLSGWRLDCEQGAALGAARRLLAWFCPAGTGQLGDQVAGPLPFPGLVGSRAAKRSLSQLRSSSMLQESSESSWAGTRYRACQARERVVWLLPGFLSPLPKANEASLATGTSRLLNGWV